MKIRTTAKAILITLTAVFMLCSSVTVLAAPDVSAEQTTDLCNACMLVDYKTGTVLYESEKCSEQIAPASTTKIMTAVIILENCDLTENVTVGPEVDIIGTKMGLIEGETLTVKDLLYGMMLPSGNDAAIALATFYSGSVEAFAEKMNEKAAELEMTDSHFLTPHGLDKEDHYVSVKDMAKLALYAVNIPEFMEIVGTAKYSVSTNKHSDLTVENTNKLLYKADNDPADYTYSCVNGIKTGATPNAGSCIVASALKDNMGLIALVYGTPSESAQNKWKVARYLFDYGFENFDTLDISGFSESYPVTASVSNARLEDGSRGISEIKCCADIPEGTCVTIEKSEDDMDFTADFIPLTSSLQAPVYSGDVVGKIVFKLNGTELYRADAIATETVLYTSEEAESDSPVTPLKQINIDDEKKPITKEQINSTIWWFIGPLLGIGVVLIIFMVIKASNGERKTATFIDRPSYVDPTSREARTKRDIAPAKPGRRKLFTKKSEPKLSRKRRRY